MQAFMLWQTFLQNVNPLSKVIHAPLVQPQVIEASKDFDSVPKPAIALLFAIYAAAVMSLKEEECQAQLNGPKTVLLGRFFSACQQALAAASFMKSRNIVTLQAYVIFLVRFRVSHPPHDLDSQYHSFPPDRFTMFKPFGCSQELRSAWG